MKGNIRKYYFYQFFQHLGFFSPVIVLFWQSRGLSLTQIMLLQSIYAIAVVILELPTGAFADYFGKKISLILGSFSACLGFIIYSLCLNFWQFAAGEIIFALGMAFISGADSAFIHETLISIKREKDYKKIEGKARGINQLAQTLGSLFGGFIGSFSLALTLITTAFSGFIAALFGLSFAKTKVKLPREEKTRYLEIIKDSLKIIKNNSSVLWLTLFFATFNGLVWSSYWFSQPYLQMLGVPIVYFGIIFAGINLISAIGSSLVDKFMKLTWGKPFLVMGLVSSLVMFLLGRFPSLYIFPLWSLFITFTIMSRTLVSDQVLALVPPERAATVLSFQNLLRRFVYAFFGPISGIMADKLGILAALQFNAIVLFLVLGLLRLSRRRILTPS